MSTPAELVQWLNAVSQGDRAAFELLYAATRAKLYGVVLRILRRHDLADEVLQEVYLKIWSGAGQFNPGLASPITWMVTIARNRAIDLVRKRAEVSIESLVLLAYRNGWSREQLAAKLGKPVNTIKTWLRRSLLEIRECLGS